MRGKEPDEDLVAAARRGIEQAVDLGIKPKWRN
jgi:hypothetical protein